MLGIIPRTSIRQFIQGHTKWPLGSCIVHPNRDTGIVEKVGQVCRVAILPVQGSKPRFLTQGDKAISDRGRYISPDLFKAIDFGQLTAERVKIG